MRKPVRSVTKNCERCNSLFERPYGISATQWASRKYCSKRCSATKTKIPVETIMSMYEEGMSSIDIGKKAGVSGTQIRRILKRHGVQIRPLASI